MTMTRDKIEELKAYAQTCDSLTESCFMSAQRLLSLLALAERALEPQGQALPELPPLPEPVAQVTCYDQHPNGVAGRLLSTELAAADDYFTADDMHAYARAYASQLALPAGPTDEQIKKAIQELDECEAFNDDGVTKEAIAIIRKLFDPSPAVAQPVADERLDARRWRAAIKHGGVHIGNGITLDGEDAVVAVDVLLKAMDERGEA